MPQLARVDRDEYTQIGESFGIERLRFPVYRSTDDGSVVLNFADMGNPQGFVMRQTIAKYGREKPFSPMLLDAMMGSGIKAFPTENIYIQDGIDPDPPLQVVGVSSSQVDGTALRSVELVINGPNGINVDWVNEGDIIVGGINDDRSYSVIGTGTQGVKQTITVEPKNAIYDLSVSGGISREFPNDSWVVLFGRNYNSERGTVDGIQRQYNVGGQRDFSLMAKEHDEILKGRDLKQHYQMPREDSLSSALNGEEFGIDPDSPYAKIRLYVTEKQMFNTWQLMQNMYKALMFEEPDQRKVPGIYTGSGLKPQIDTEAFYRASTREVLDVLKRIIWDMKANNALAGDVLRAYLGTELYIVITEALRNANYLNARLDRNFTEEQARRDLYVGQTMRGMYVAEFGGCMLHLIEDETLSSTRVSGKRSSISPNVGSRASEGFIVDQSPVMNLNMRLNGELVTEDIPKLMLWSEAIPTEDGEVGQPNTFGYHFNQGIIDKDGRPIVGEVNNFSETYKAKYIARMGCALLDPRSVSHLQLV